MKTIETTQITSHKVQLDDGRVLIVNVHPSGQTIWTSESGMPLSPEEQFIMNTRLANSGGKVPQVQDETPARSPFSRSELPAGGLSLEERVGILEMFMRDQVKGRPSAAPSGFEDFFQNTTGPEGVSGQCCAGAVGQVPETPGLDGLKSFIQKVTADGNHQAVTLPDGRIAIFKTHRIGVPAGSSIAQILKLLGL